MSNAGEVLELNNKITSTWSLIGTQTERHTRDTYTTAVGIFYYLCIKLFTSRIIYMYCFISNR